MSMFARLFGKKTGDNQPAKPQATRSPQPAHPPANQGGSGGGGTSRVVNRMDDTIEAMDARERQLQKKIDLETQRAKEAMAKKNRNLAMLCMKRKKLYEDNLQKLANQRANMETIKITMEDSAMNAEVLRAQRDATNELERINNGMDADKVEDDMDRMRDAMDEQARIAEMLGQPIGTDVVDEDDLMDELNEMMAEDKKAEKAAKKAAEKPKATATADPAPIDMGPKVPTSKLPETAKPAEPIDEDEEALRRLEEELNAA
uniref:Uncharacterized protein n=1 Tax=Neobodo designis TaxID=312471 RepID=A0A7S1LNC2_NEODS|mmetsp:Transcript_25281/g.78044  ORF Transcript_25281/g.78044 Transcript_25281/m.78044 type:complete len:260 (+) Transcript_25281:101-880(+)